MRPKTDKDLLNLFRERLDIALNGIGVPAMGEGRAAWLATACGVERSTTRLWVKGESLPAVGHLVKLSHATHTPVGFFVDSAVFSPTALETTDIPFVPLHPMAAPPDFRAALSPDLLRHLVEDENTDGLYLSMAIDDAMSPTIPRRSVVMLSRDVFQVQFDAIYLFEVEGATRMFRRLQLAADGVTLACDNTLGYTNLQVPATDIRLPDMNDTTTPYRIIGRVVVVLQRV